MTDITLRIDTLAREIRYYVQTVQRNQKHPMNPGDVPLWRAHEKALEEIALNLTYRIGEENPGYDRLDFFVACGFPDPRKREEEPNVALQGALAWAAPDEMTLDELRRVYKHLNEGGEPRNDFERKALAASKTGMTGATA